MTGLYDVVTIAINSVNVTLLEGSFSLQDSLEQRSVFTFTVLDASGTASFPNGSHVAITSLFWGNLYTGVVLQDDDLSLWPDTRRTHKIQCVDNRYFADKVYFRKGEYVNMIAGDILIDLLNSYLSAEGISALYAYRPDTTQTAMAQGTLTNVVATPTPTLELASAGSTVTKDENVASDWNAGTRFQVATVGNTLTMASYSAIKLSGQSVQGITNVNNYMYVVVWKGSITIASGDNLVYNVWVPSTNPQIQAGVDFTFSDGSVLRATGVTDQNGIVSHPNADISGYATDMRYTRTVTLTNPALSLLGKTIVSCSVAIEGDTPGHYDAYFDGIQLNNGSTRQWFYQSGATQCNTLTNNAGYNTITIGIVNAHDETAYRVSPAYSIASVGIVQASTVNWTFAMSDPATNSTTTTGDATATAPVTTGPNKIDYIVMETSIDGGKSWQLCTNHGPIPLLLPGMKTAGLSVLMRQTLNIAGPDTTNAPILTTAVISVTPSYATTKTDVHASYGTATDWATGSLSNVRASVLQTNDLCLNGYYRSYADPSTAGLNETIYGTTVNSGPVHGPFMSWLYLRCDSGHDARNRLDWMPSTTNFTFEMDVMITNDPSNDLNTGEYGVSYRTTYWGNGDNTQGYTASITATGVVLSHGSNSSSGAYTMINTYTVPGGLARGTWYHLKVIANGSNHQVFVDDIRYINVTDSTYTGAGQFAIRHYNSAPLVDRHNGYFKNVGMVTNTTGASGTWTSPTIVLGITTVGNSVIAWNANVPVSGYFRVQASIGGSAYAACTNNAPIPGVTAGTNISGKNLQIQVFFDSDNGSQTPELLGIGLHVSSAYTASGTRVSPALGIASVVRAQDANITWNGNQPAATSITADTSINGSSWTNVGSGAVGTAAIAGVPTQPLYPTQDVFGLNSSANYTSTYGSGGSVSTNTWDTANSRLTMVGGAYSELLYTGISNADIDLLCEMDMSDNGGLVWRRVDASNQYEVIVKDNTSTNTATLYKRVAGVRSQIGVSAINFTRNTYHQVRVTMLVGAILVYFDGVQIISYTDGSPLASGGVGLTNNGGTARYTKLWINPQGAVLSGSVYSRFTLVTNDPTVTPQLLGAYLSVHDNHIGAGALVENTNYHGKNTIAACIDDLAKRSGYWADIDKDKQLMMQQRTAKPAPFVIQVGSSVDPSTLIFLNETTPLVSYTSPLYRNRSVIYGGIDVTSLQVEKRIGNGSTQAWAMAYPLASYPAMTLTKPSVSLNGYTATVGIQGVDTGMQFYYTPGSNMISQDLSLIPPDPLETMVFSYIGQEQVEVQYDDLVEQAAYKAIEGGSGIVEVVESVPTLLTAAALSYATAQVNTTKTRARTLTFKTKRGGLQTGHLASVYLPQNKIVNGQFLITSITTTFVTTPDTTALAFYTVTCTEGPIIGSWARLFTP